ncbi:MAG: rhodanese-like domain-containing protein [Candidatus Cryptobacteroides sp.]
MNRYLVMGILCSILGMNGCNAQSGKYRTVDAEEFAKVIADTSVVLLDVRTSEEYQQGHIGDALNIDVLQNGFAEKVAEAVPEGRTIALYCRSGNRSKKAASVLSGKYAVIELGTGYLGWVEKQ